MDPQACLNELIMGYGDGWESNMEWFYDRMEALDEWLAKGGFQPEAMRPDGYFPSGTSRPWVCVRVVGVSGRYLLITDRVGATGTQTCPVYTLRPIKPSAP